jgi:hypothetical protein
MDDRNTYFRIVELWVRYKSIYPDSNPSAFIITELTGKPYSGQEPDNAVEVMEVVGKIKGFAPLSLEERNRIAVEATMEMPGFLPNRPAVNPASGLKIMAVLTWIGYGLGIFSMLHSGFSWWVLGFIIAFWWAGGAARMASQKQRVKPGPSWKMPAHIGIHIATFIGLLIVSIKHIT